ncbi:MAG: NAD/NADP octopine/nopaline dehydrogenase family protein [Bacillota bacterium]|nr:NAD/NADP octopine/nopaline dehydrogenase family protein [Bacillota bacterium]
MLITVCGCGNAGIAQAADIALLGFDVNLFEMADFENNLTVIKEKKGITLSGKTLSGQTGFAKLHKVTSNAEEAVKGVDLIILAVPAQNHNNVMEHILPHLTPGQIVLVSTGYWASLRLNKLLVEQGLQNKIMIVELNIFPYLSAKIGPAKAHIYNYKRLMKVSTFPATKNDSVYKIVKQIYPQTILSKNVLDNNIYPGNQSLHPQITLPNVVLFFEKAKEFRFYNELSLATAKLADAFDLERLKVANHYDCDTTDYVTAFKKMYEYSGENLYELFSNTEHSERWGRVEGIYRVLIEDLCYSLFPIEQLAKAADISVPITSSMIDLFKVFTGYDYRSNGITLKDLGIEGFKTEQILKYVNQGNVS